MADNGCHYCGPTDRELRPYGPGGANVCFPCATETPEREQSAKHAFGALLDGAEAVSVGPVMIGSEEGPIPFDPLRLADGVCDKTELPVDQCAHCTGATLEGPKPVRTSMVFPAGKRGNCGHCDARYDAGTQIASAVINGERLWCIASHTVGSES